MKYYAVTSTFRDNGTTSAMITDVIEAEEKPESSFRSWRDHDSYVDWYPSKQEAEAAVKEALSA